MHLSFNTSMPVRAWMRQASITSEISVARAFEGHFLFMTERLLHSVGTGATLLLNHHDSQ